MVRRIRRVMPKRTLQRATQQRRAIPQRRTPQKRFVMQQPQTNLTLEQMWSLRQRELFLREEAERIREERFMQWVMRGVID
jgi:hypothetical protein